MKLIVAALILVALGAELWNFGLSSTLAAAALFSLLAVSTDFAANCAGVLNLGPCLHFGIGAYWVAHSLKVGHSVLWGIVAGVLGAALIAFISALLLLRHTRVGFTYGLAGLCLCLAAQQMATQSYGTLGGSNGITGFTSGTHSGSFSSLVLNTAAIVTAGTTFFGLRALHLSQLGRVLVLVRDEPERAQRLGYSLFLLRSSVSVLSALVAALAGGLYALTVGVAHPSIFSVGPNMLVFVWIAFGGGGTLTGPFLAALSLRMLEYRLGSQLENVYLLCMSLLFTVVVLFMPAGVFHSLRRRHPTTVHRTTGGD